MYDQENHFLPGKIVGVAVVVVVVVLEVVADIVVVEVVKEDAVVPVKQCFKLR